jgi:hypothetical protein
MNIGEIEEAVDRIIAKRENPNKDKKNKSIPKKEQNNNGFVCPECERRKRLRKDIIQVKKSNRKNVLCPGRHADVVDSLVSSKKKAM